MTVRILVSGSRSLLGIGHAHDVWRRLYEAVEEFGDDLVVVEGGARGADYMARCWASWTDHPWETHKAHWRLYGSAAGPIRNRAMAEAGARRLYAFPMGDSPGTRDMIGVAAKTGIETIVTEMTPEPETRPKVYVDNPAANAVWWTQTTIDGL